MAEERRIARWLCGLSRGLGCAHFLNAGTDCGHCHIDECPRQPLSIC
ncbi:hypothetical protein CVCC1112_3441 [Paenarthrobacter nicotinovorans]|nr:hypothetical protein CVCC1112_3441 [Paenarthrobacter nicotinovorans]